TMKLQQPSAKPVKNFYTHLRGMLPRVVLQSQQNMPTPNTEYPTPKKTASRRRRLLRCSWEKCLKVKC
ncbi:hypothetical protein, partial [Hydrotalea flava]|uniref:hypothetical protein n=1 Tax=Hydrotalea flava TaxID=714549 RepID=UPI0020A44522